MTGQPTLKHTSLPQKYCKGLMKPYQGKQMVFISPDHKASYFWGGGMSGGATWRIIPLSKWLGSPPLPFFWRGSQPQLGNLLNDMVANYLQVLEWSSKYFMGWKSPFCTTILGEYVWFTFSNSTVGMIQTVITFMASQLTPQRFSQKQPAFFFELRESIGKFPSIRPANYFSTPMAAMILSWTPTFGDPRSEAFGFVLDPLARHWNRIKKWNYDPFRVPWVELLGWMTSSGGSIVWEGWKFIETNLWVIFKNSVVIFKNMINFHNIWKKRTYVWEGKPIFQWFACLPKIVYCLHWCHIMTLVMGCGSFWVILYLLNLQWNLMVNWCELLGKSDRQPPSSIQQCRASLWPS